MMGYLAKQGSFVVNLGFILVKRLEYLERFHFVTLLSARVVRFSHYSLELHIKQTSSIFGMAARVFLVMDRFRCLLVWLCSNNKFL